MMANDGIAKRIAELKAERSKRVQFTADDLFNELVKVGTSTIVDSRSAVSVALINDRF